MNLKRERKKFPTEQCKNEKIQEISNDILKFHIFSENFLDQSL